MMMTNGLVWLFYSLLIKNWFIFFANILSLPMSLFYLSVTLPLETNLSKRLQFVYMAMTGSSLVFFIASLCFIHFTPDTSKLVFGLVGNIIAFLFVASPLASIYTIIQTRNADSINLYFAYANLMNGVLWLTYGLCIQDYFVAAPNCAGLSLTFIQLVIKFMYRETAAESNTKTEIPMRNYQSLECAEME